MNLTELTSETEILDLIGKNSKYPLKAGNILSRLGLDKEYKRSLKRLLADLIQKRKLKKIRGGRYVTVDSSTDQKPANQSYTKNIKNHKRLICSLVKRDNNYYLKPRINSFGRIMVNKEDFKGIRNNSLIVVENDKNKTRDFAPNKINYSILGKVGDYIAESRALYTEYNLKDTFAHSVKKELGNIGFEIDENELKRRTDLRELLIFTIDNDDARDYDDAVGIKKTKSGFKLFVSIADVSHYVKKGSSLDNEAWKRATSVYLPGKVFPMLPEKLSNDLCSLMPYQDRFTKTAEIDFARDGSVISYKVYRSIIKSAARLSYSDVNSMLGKWGRVKETDLEIVKSLKLMRELYNKLKSKRVKEGEIDLDVPEAELLRDEKGKIIDIVKAKRGISNCIIEQFMIEANTAVASFIFKKDIPSIYRVHDKPEQESIIELIQNLKELGISINGNGDTRDTLNAIAEKGKNSGLPGVVNIMILRSLKRALYTTKSDGHFGLSLEHYTHFTSPIRRYPDLVVHRIIDSILDKQGPNYQKSKLESIASHCSDREKLADEIEREAMNLERTFLMRAYIGKEFKAVVISVLSFGVFVELEEKFSEGFIPRRSIPRGIETLKMGQRVKVRIKNADFERRRITLDLLSSH